MSNSATATKTPTADLLTRLFKNTRMGSESLLALMPKIEDVKLKSDLTLQLNGYEEFAKKINHLLSEHGEKSEEESLMTKMSAKIGITMNTMMDASSSHLADMVIQGSTMGVTDTLKLVHEFTDSGADPKALSLAQEIVRFEENNIERLKSYL